MKCKRCFKKLSAAFLAFVLSLLIFMQGTLTVAATEELTVSENVIDSEDSSFEPSDDTENENDMLSETETVTIEETVTPEEAVNEDEVSEGIMLMVDSEEIEPLTTDYIGVSDLEWDSSSPGTIRFKVNDSKPAYYVIGLYKDGHIVTCLNVGNISVFAGKYFSDSLTNVINESGNYTFKVKISQDDSGNIWDFSTGQVSETSPIYRYDKPAESLPAPTGLQWDDRKKGAAKWNSVENASGYCINLYKDGVGVYGVSWNDGNASRAEYDFSSHIGAEGSYTFSVQAISSDITKWANSEWSAQSAPLGDSSEVDKTLEEIIQNDNVVAAVNDLKDESKISKSELKVAMQSDGNVQEKLRGLENKYIEQQGITVASPTVEDVAIDAGKIAVLGAGLNASSGQEVVLKLSKPSAESPYNPEVYKNVVQFNMDLLIDGSAKKELDVPVTITLPVPAGMHIDRLMILHYSSVDGTYETIYPRNNGNGTVSFTITHFSTFAFAEVEGSAGQTMTQIKQDGSSANEAESTPVWKPTTPDEIKRYACKGKEVIDYTLAKENAYPVVLMNAMQGPMCFTSFEAVLGDYTIGRTYNIYPAQNLTYSMDKEVEITIKIPAAIYRADREYKMICVTKGGQPIILEDLDKVPETITFRINRFYAFALIYK